MTALAAMQEHLLEPYQSIAVHAERDVRADKQRLRQLGPVRQPRDDAARGARAVVRHLLLRRRLPLLPRRRQGRSRMQEWARKFGFGAPTGLDIGPEAPPRRRVSCRRPPGASGRSRATGTSAWNPGDSIQLAIGQKDVTVTPLQMARFYAMIANGGKLVTPYVVSQAETPAASGQSPIVQHGSRPTRPRSSASTRPRSRSCATGSTRQRTRSYGTSSGVFASFPDPVSPARRARPRRSCRSPATRRTTSRTSRGGAATGRRRPRSRARRLRGDRERRPRLDGRRPGGAARLRAVLRRQRRPIQTLVKTD